MELTPAELADVIRGANPSVPVPDASSALAELVGRNVFVRTVTHHHTGRLAAVDGQFLTLDDAAWIADDGRFHEALRDGKLNEVEPFPGRCFVAVGAVVDVCEWLHDLPRSVK